MREQLKALVDYLSDEQLKNVFEYAQDELDAPSHEEQLLKMLESMIISNTMHRVRNTIAGADTLDDAAKQAVNALLDTILK